MAILASPFVIPVAAIVGVFSWLTVSSVIAGMRGIVRHRNEVELKQMLVDRGMSADEIAQVVSATAIDDSDDI